MIAEQVLVILGSFVRFFLLLKSGGQAKENFIVQRKVSILVQYFFEPGLNPLDHLVTLIPSIIIEASDLQDLALLSFPGFQPD